MSYKIFYHPKVKEEDLPAIDSSIQKRIFRSIESRLITAPEKYGKPLRRTLKGYWKLRVDDYWIVCKIVKKEVWIFLIIHRDKVYQIATQRLN